MNHIPQFPLFKKVELSDRAAYEKYYSQFEPYSDFSFNNMWIWFNQQGNLGFSFHEDSLIVRFDNPFDSDRINYTLIGKRNCGKALHRLLRWQQAMHLDKRVVMVPEIVIKNLGQIHAPLNISEDIDNLDYVCDVDRMSSPSGKDFVKYRHALTHFKTHYEDGLSVQVANLADTSQRTELINSLHTWDSTYRQSDQSRLEGAALDRLFVLADILPVNCLVVRHNDKIISFAIFQIAPQPSYAIVNHLKCNNEYRYIFDATFSYLINELSSRNIHYVNIEQDLGIPGLREHKRRLRPVLYLRRYTVNG